MIMFLFSFVSFSCRAQEMNLDEILSKYYQAIGMTHIKEWKTLTMTFKSSNAGIEYPFVAITKRPGKLRSEMEIQGNKMIQAFDGHAGWIISPWSGSSDPRDMTADDVKFMKEQADMDGALVDWKEKGHKVELIGKEDMEGTPAYKIKIIKANGDIETDFIDAENFVPIKVSSVSKVQGNDVEGDSYPGNYKEVNGAMLPFLIENKFKGQNGEVNTQHILIEKYEVDKPVDDSLFVKPAKKH